MDNIFEYGIKFNFNGNYEKATQHIGNFFNKFSQSVNTLSGATLSRMGSFFSAMHSGFSQMDSIASSFYGKIFNIYTLLAGGAFTVAVKNSFGTLITLGKQMETTFAQLQTTLGGKDAAAKKANTMEALAWARKKGVETPFEISEVNDAVRQMTMFGLAKNKAMREKTFQAIGDFAGNFNMSFGEAVGMVSKAGFGETEWLKNRTGITRTTIGETVRNSRNINEKDRAYAMELVNIIQKGAVGTEKFKMAWVEVLGLLNKGGMENRMKTLGGALSNVSDLSQNFLMDMIGYTQMEDSLMSKITKTTQNFLSAFSRVLYFEYEDIKHKKSVIPLDTLKNKLNTEDGKLVYQKLINQKALTDEEKRYLQVTTGLNAETLKSITYTTKLGNIATGLKKIFIILWQSVDTAVSGMTKKFTDWIDKFERRVTDFKGFVAPLIVYVYLLWSKVKGFFTGLWEGFSVGFGAMMKVGKTAFNWLVSFFKLFTGDTAKAIHAVGVALGVVAGALLGFKVLGTIVGPFGKFLSMTKEYAKVAGGTGKLADIGVQKVYVVNMPTNFGMGGTDIPGSNIPGKGGKFSKGVKNLGEGMLITAAVIGAKQIVDAGIEKIAPNSYLRKEHVSSFMEDLRPDSRLQPKSWKELARLRKFYSYGITSDESSVGVLSQEFKKQMKLITSGQEGNYFKDFTSKMFDTLNSMLAAKGLNLQNPEDRGMVIEQLNFNLDKNATANDVIRVIAGLKQQFKVKQ